MKATILFSGGLDSTMCLYWAINRYGLENVSCIVFHYGQKAENEIVAANVVCKLVGVPIKVLYLPSGLFKTTSPILADKEMCTFEKHSDIDSNKISETFIPMRNPIFLSILMNNAYSYGSKILIMGNTLEGEKTEPDCSREFITAFTTMARTALADEDINVYSPCINLTKKRIVERCLWYSGCWQVLAYTYTSHINSRFPDQRDCATIFRETGFAEAGLPDPLVLRTHQQNPKEFPLPASENYDVFRCNAIPHDYGEELFRKGVRLP